jgi:hypothetical protein
MDPAWAAIGVGVVSSLLTAGLMAAVNFAALKSWMARREEREANLSEDVRDHEARIRHLEHGQPFDYVPR